MNTGTNTPNREGYPEKPGQTSQQGSDMGNENYQSQEMNREHSDNIKAGEHAYQQDETQYGKIRESETGTGQRAENLREQVDKGVNNAGTETQGWADKAENKINEWTDKAENKMKEMKENVQNKMDDWSGKTDHERAEDKYEKADKKMDKAEKKMEKAQDKFAKGYENDGMRKMEKAEKKMDKAEDKIQDAHENLGGTTGNYSSAHNAGKDNAEDYQKNNQNNRSGNDNTHSGFNR